jgi:putative phage-type endonuclease
MFALVNIIDKIVPEDSVIYTEEFSEMIFDLMIDYVLNNPKAIVETDFHETLMSDVHDLIMVQFSEEVWLESEKEDLEEILECVADLFYECIYPKRSHEESILLNESLSDGNILRIKAQLEYLKNLPQPAQRTKEWYAFRHNLITASNAYKAFENDSAKNQLIWEKCQPLKTENDSTDNILGPNINTPMHWGQKYEPVSVIIYEDMYGTKVGDFGCIQHPRYYFLGASPDGINIDETNPRYGRMLEIKNIVNREIDGIPKIEYWIQMQLQTETCDLDECDFLETKFVEYEGEVEFSEDKETPSNRKGIIMYFSNPHLYVYAPLRIHENPEELQKWEEKMMEENKERSFIKYIYWKAECVSCVLVERNRTWFQDNIEELRKVWNIIEKERVTGYGHRAPNKREKKQPFESKSKGCLIQLNKDSGKVSISAEKKISFGKLEIIKIHTSLD